MSTGEKPLNPVAAWRFTMLVPDVRTPALRQVLFDWLRKLRLAMGSITDASRMSVRSRYLSEPKGPFLNAKKNDSAAINNGLFLSTSRVYPIARIEAQPWREEKICLGTTWGKRHQCPWRDRAGGFNRSAIALRTVS